MQRARACRELCLVASALLDERMQAGGDRGGAAELRDDAVAARRPGSNLNALLDENLRDPLSGNSVLSGVPVRLEPENA